MQVCADCKVRPGTQQRTATACRALPAGVAPAPAAERRGWGCRRMAVANMVLSPFLFVFLAIHFFLRNAEQLYHHPSSVGARRWSPLARWRLREFNELPHFIDHRCPRHGTEDCSADGARWWSPGAALRAMLETHSVSRSLCLGKF